MVAWPDFRARFRRFLVTGVGIALVLAVTLLLSGFAAGFATRIDRLIDSVGGTHYLTIDGGSGPFTSTAGFPVTDLPAGDPIIVAPNSIDIGSTSVGVVVLGATDGGAGWPAVTEGRQIAGPDEIVTDDQLEAIGLGDEVTIAGRRFTVVGHTSGVTWDVANAGVTMSLDSARELFANGAGVATSVVLDERPDQVPDGLSLHTRDDAFDDMRVRFDAIKRSIDSFRITLWILAVVIVGAVLYLAALERVRDFAVFKATGASNRHLRLGLALQAVLLGLVAGATSIVLAYVMRPVYPGVITLGPAVVWPAIPVAVVIAIIGSIVGIRRAVAVDPSSAFGGA